jgi:hypothetical protein
MDINNIAMVFAPSANALISLNPQPVADFPSIIVFYTDGITLKMIAFQEMEAYFKQMQIDQAGLGNVGVFKSGVENDQFGFINQIDFFIG